MKKIIYEIISAVHYLHTKEIKFLNLTLKDVLITSRGEVKIHNYCMAYLFSDYLHNPNSTQNFFKNKFRYRMMCMYFPNRYKHKEEGREFQKESYKTFSYLKKDSHSFKNLHTDVVNQENKVTYMHRTKNNKKGTKSKFLRMNPLNTYNSFITNPLYYPPFILLLDLMKNKKTSPMHDLYKHIDIFSVGIIILQMVNGLFGFTFAVKNFLHFKEAHVTVQVKRERRNPNVGENSMHNSMHDSMHDSMHNSMHDSMHNSMHNSMHDSSFPSSPSCTSVSCTHGLASVPWKREEMYCKRNIRKDMEKHRVVIQKNNTITLTDNFDKVSSAVMCIDKGSNFSNPLLVEKLDEKVGYIEDAACTIHSHSKYLMDEVYESILEFEELRKDRQGKEASMCHRNNEEGQFYVEKLAEGGEDIFQKIETIFVFLLYIKIYHIFRKENGKKQKKKQKKKFDNNGWSLLNINAYTMFRAHCKYQDDVVKKKYKHMNMITYQIVKNIIEGLFNFKISIRFIKRVENMLSEFFTMHVVKQNLRNIKFETEKYNEKIFFLNFMQKCLSLEYDNKSDGYSSLLSHYYFYNHVDTNNRTLVYRNTIMKNIKMHRHDKIVRNGEYYNTCSIFQKNAEDRKNKVMITYKEERSTEHSYKKKLYYQVSHLDKEENPHIECYSIREDPSAGCYYYNEHMVEYVKSTSKEKELMEKYFIEKRDVYYWFDVLYKINYFDELAYLNIVNKSSNILKIPYIVYKRKNRYFEFLFFYFYKLLLLNRYQGVFNVYKHLLRGRGKLRSLNAGTSYFRSKHKMNKCKCHSYVSTRGSCINGYIFSVKIRQSLHLCKKNHHITVTRSSPNDIKDKIRMGGEPIRMNTCLSSRMEDTKMGEGYADGSSNQLNELGGREGYIGNTCFFNIPIEEEYFPTAFTDYRGKRILGIKLAEFYDVIEDAYEFIQLKNRGHITDREEKKKKIITTPVMMTRTMACESERQETSVYENDFSFIYQYSLHLNLQKLLKADPLNTFELLKEVKCGFPYHMRTLAYLTLLGYSYYLLVRKSAEKEEKMKYFIHGTHLRKIIGREVMTSIRGRKIYPCWNIHEIDRKKSRKNLSNRLTKVIRNSNTSENDEVDRQNIRTYGKLKRCDGNFKDDLPMKEEGESRRHTDIIPHEWINKKGVKRFLKKYRLYSDLVGSTDFAERMYSLLLLLNIKFGIKNKYLKNLLLPLILLYYNDIYLCYKCSKKLIQNYLLDIYTNKQNLGEFLYTFNCLLNHYIPELSLFFFKNSINISNIIYSWVCSLFANFFDLQNIFLLLDKILTQPRSFIFFICISILIYLKRYILMMSMCRYNLHKHLFALATLVNLNFVLKNSMHMFHTCPIMHTQFPRVITSLEKEGKISEENFTQIEITHGDERDHMNYLSYLIMDTHWMQYYVHKNTFQVYKKGGGRGRSVIREIMHGKTNSGSGRSIDSSHMNLIKEGRVSRAALNFLTRRRSKRGGGLHRGEANREEIKRNVVKLKIPKRGKLKFSKIKLNKSKLNKSKLNKSKLNKSKLNTLKHDKFEIDKLKHNKLEMNKLKDGKKPKANSGITNLCALQVANKALETEKKKKKMTKRNTPNVTHYYELFLKNYNINKKKKNLSEFSHYENKIVTKYKHKVKETKHKEKESVQRSNENNDATKKRVCYKLTDKKIKKRFKIEDLVRLYNFPMFPFFYVTDLADELSLENYIIVDMRSPEEFKKKRLKHSVHVNTFLTNFKKGLYNNYLDDSYETDIHLKTIILGFNGPILDFDIIYNFLNLKIKRITILWGGLQYAMSNMPSNYFT
ncbi:Rab GTPase activator and protein kinase [Plasmodium gonderi]|uniref:Rab GTPase activator and protein kinase n=1 Tax=Plasmodium gonderi TaxID=77519 RepID=A0A1Y1JA48_PLAGO|nr:Rab GTPase activator and protein kinase [Plasmodium gonderi]GAW79379.1 Rab GTPase activator and protein kinase [Plasmodium gonderi]